MDSKKYYEAYDERYKTAHKEGIRWFGDESSPIVSETISKYQITKDSRILEIGCGEGRDSFKLLENGYNLLAIDISTEVIDYCRKLLSTHKDSFKVLNCITDSLEENYDFIYAVAVIHMLVLDEDRNGFYRFIHNHLSLNGIALICSMGNGEQELQSDISTAFELQEREHDGKQLFVAGTSCRMVNNETFENELIQKDLTRIERGQTSVPGQFSEMMYAIVKRK